MVFSSITFLFFFLPFVLLVYYVLPGIKTKNGFLLLSSLVFYAWGEPVFVLLILLSALINYAFGLLVGTQPQLKWPLIIGVAINLGLLATVKYADFLVENFNLLVPEDFHLPLPNVPLPLGVSFFTFQGLSYLVDIHRGHGRVQKNPLNSFLYITLFPQLIAGPIVRYHHIASELNRRIHHIGLFREGVERFILGLAKKVLIANTMGELADFILNDPHSWNSTTTFIGMVAYSLQIYFDFSGYSDMAIGLGKMFGFNLHENFNFPYQSKSIQEFWRRWHISLSTWFRDYLYIPLGGNRKGSGRTYFNLVVVFFLTGLWHGASWNFVLWGLFHGFFLIVERIGFKKTLDRIPFIGHIYTLGIVMVAWMLFRLETFGEFTLFMKQLLSFEFSGITELMALKHMLIMGLGIAFSVQWFPRFIQLPAPMAKFTTPAYNLVLLGLFILCCLQVANSTYNPFIYYRF